MRGFGGTQWVCDARTMLSRYSAVFAEHVRCFLTTRSMSRNAEKSASLLMVARVCCPPTATVLGQVAGGARTEEGGCWEEGGGLRGERGPSGLKGLFLFCLIRPGY